MRIEIQKRTDRGHKVRDVYEVRVADADLRTMRMFRYPTIEAARRAASAYGDRPIDDKS